MDSNLTLEKQIMQLKVKSFKMVRKISKIRTLLSSEQLKIIVNSFTISLLDYCNGLYHGCSARLMNQLQLIQNACAKIITGKYKHDHLGDDLKGLHWLNVRRRIVFKLGLLAYKSLNGQAPLYLQELFQYSHHGHVLKLIIPNFSSKYGLRSFSVAGPRLLNNLPQSVVTCSNVQEFKASFKTFLFNISDSDLEKLTKCV